MLRRIQFCRAVWLLLTAILVVAACHPALACESCPRKPREMTSHCSHETLTVVTERVEQCSHCFTHSPSQANSSRAVVVNAPSHGIVAGYPYVVVIRFSPSTNAIEIHAHGPPGRSSPRYVLNHTFRI
ncbi:MAG TPA: hypothetical protein VJP89_24515 [Pyrinomonadaceae bacterium]|nr:hypothetical protein [Pyrinomonadaceae bacterium]